MRYDVFISHHRKSGIEYARMLQQALTRKGYRCFLDVDSVRDGEFQDKILGALRSAPNFVFVLTSGALDGISNPADHIRIELEEALRLGRKVVVAAPRGYRSGFFCENLPTTLKVLEKIQVTLLDTDVFFEKSVDMIEARFAKYKRHVKCFVVLLTIAGALMLLAVGLIWMMRQRYSEEDPYAGETYLEVPDDEQVEIPDEKAEQILKRMMAMRLPAISFKPPATIVDAVEYFRGASVDFDRPELPKEQRGFIFSLKTWLDSYNARAIDDDLDDFGCTRDDTISTRDEIPVIPMVYASDITLYDALKLVCENVAYGFVVQGEVVVVLPKDMAIEPLELRCYDVSQRLHDILTDWAVHDGGIDKSLKFAEAGLSDQDVMAQQFLTEFDVAWYRGTSIRYLLSINQLKVCNTSKELHRIERVLSRLKVLKAIHYENSPRSE